MHPYQSAPDRAFWSRSIILDPDPISLLWDDRMLIHLDDTIVSAGSCFAANIVPYLERSAFRYLRTEGTHPIERSAGDDNFGYSKFSASYGNVYTARQLLQLLLRSLGDFQPAEDRFSEGGRLVDVFRPGLRFAASGDAEFDLLNRQHLRAVKQAFSSCNVFIFTLGLTEAWVSKRDGSVFPACPGTVAGSFDPEKHEFVNFTSAEVVADFAAFLEKLQSINPGVRIVLTVSPVPLVATATTKHVLSANTYSKASLLIAAHEIAARFPNVIYFPAFEIITGPQAPDRYFSADRRNPTPEGIAAVMRAFLHGCGIRHETKWGNDGAGDTPVTSAPATSPAQASRLISSLIVARECEEAMEDVAVGPAESP